MNTHSLFTSGCFTVLVMFGSAFPVFAEPFPQPKDSQTQVIIDWEDEFIQDASSTRMTAKQKSMTHVKKPVPHSSSNAPVIDWEDEFSDDVSVEDSARNKNVMVEKENAASWDHEAWQAM